MSAYRRSYNRFAINGPCVLVTAEGSHEQSVLKDLCARGAGVLSHAALSLNQKITLVTKMPSFMLENNLTKEATIAWSRRINDNFWQHGLDFGETNKINILPTHTGLSFSQ